MERVDGLQFDKGFPSPHFINEEAQVQCCIEKPYVLVHEKKISSATAFLPLLETIAQSGKPLLVLAVGSIDEQSHRRGVGSPIGGRPLNGQDRVLAIVDGK